VQRRGTLNAPLFAACEIRIGHLAIRVTVQAIDRGMARALAWWAAAAATTTSADVAPWLGGVIADPNVTIPNDYLDR
jgi:hypothetical protein